MCIFGCGSPSLSELEEEITRSRMTPDARRAQVLAAAVATAQSVGYLKLTRERVAERAGISVGLVNRYFYGMDDLKRCVMEEAISAGHLAIVAQGLAAGDVVALAAPPAVRSAAIAQFGVTCANSCSL